MKKYMIEREIPRVGALQEEELRQAAAKSNQVLEQLGPALVAQKSMFLYGPSGTGKSSLAERVLRIYNDRIAVPLAVEHGMVSRANNHKEIACRAAVGSSITFPRQTYALAIPSPCFDSDFQRFSVRDRAFAVAGGTHCEILAGTVAARALHVELHASTRLGNLARAVALGTFAGSF